MERPRVYGFLRYEYEVAHQLIWCEEDEDKPWEEYKKECPEPQEAFDEIIMGEGGYEDAELIRTYVVEGYSWYVEGTGPGRYREVVISRKRYHGTPVKDANEVLTEV